MKLSNWSKMAISEIDHMLNSDAEIGHLFSPFKWAIFVFQAIPLTHFAHSKTWPISVPAIFDHFGDSKRLFIFNQRTH